LKEGNMYIILKPEDQGFEIVGADLLPTKMDTFTGTQMYILFAGLMQLATTQQDLVMETGHFMISTQRKLIGMCMKCKSEYCHVPCGPL